MSIASSRSVVRVAAAAVAIALSSVVPGAFASLLKTEEAKPPQVEESAPLSVARLNRFLFDGNVIECGSDCAADNYIVMFGAPWYGPSKEMTPFFRHTGDQWQNKMNADSVMRQHLRFAEVDCATDKELCNLEQVDNYPTVVHYRGSRRISVWSPKKAADFDGLDEWIGTTMLESKAAGSGRLFFDERDDREEQASLRAPAAPAWQVALVATVMVGFVGGNVGIVLQAAGLTPFSDAAESNADTLEDAELKKEDVPAPELEGLARYLPSEWAEDRGTIDL